MSDNNYDRDKLSWREIDALKNKSRHVKNDSKDDLSSFQKREEASAKKALESLFEPKKSKREALDWKKLEKLAGGDFSKQASLFVKKLFAVLPKLAPLFE